MSTLNATKRIIDVSKLSQMVAVSGRMIAVEELHGQAVEYAVAALDSGKDWQEVQHDLLNGRYAPLFPSAVGEGSVSDEDGEATMAIIREAEEKLGWA
jgi:hypothetical protein